MLKRTVSYLVLSTIHNRRVFSLTAISNRQQQQKSRNRDDNSTELRNEHRPFAKFHSPSPTFKNRYQKANNEEDLDVKRPQFNRYNISQSRPRTASKTRKSIPNDDEETDLFAEEKDDLTMLGTDRKAFSSFSPLTPAQKPTASAVSVSKKTDSLNIPLEVLIKPDLRDLYTDEEIHRSLELYISEISPALRPFTFDLAYLINESATLKRFVEMGVDVYRWNQPNAKAKYVLTLDFERDCMPHLVFLNELGIKNKHLTQFLSYNPWIFKEALDDLRVRINYLESKGFSRDDLREICIRAPYLLNLSTKTIEMKLNWYRKKFQLANNEMIHFAVRAPKLLTLPLQDISDTYFKMHVQLGFEYAQLNQIFQHYPKLFIYDYKLIEINFDFLYNEMNISRERLLDYPPILKQSFQQLRTRCLYLKYLQRQQFDPSKPNFVSVKDLCLKTNGLFCQHVTKTPLQAYLNFMKTL